MIINKKIFLKQHYIVVVLLFPLLSFYQCEKTFSTSLATTCKLFDEKKLTDLSLDNIESFWMDDTIYSVTDYITSHFNLDNAHIASIRYNKKDGDYLGVSVFQSQKAAINAMEKRALDVAAIVFSGDSSGEFYEEYRNEFWSKDTQNRIQDRWWWSIYIFGNAQRGIYINKWNTIIEVGILNDDLSDNSRLLLEDTAIEIANRVDAKSDPL